MLKHGCRSGSDIKVFVVQEMEDCSLLFGAQGFLCEANKLLLTGFDRGLPSPFWFWIGNHDLPLGWQVFEGIHSNRWTMDPKGLFDLSWLIYILVQVGSS